MPMYDILCDRCGPLEDEIASVGQHDARECPVCGFEATYVFNPVNIDIQGIIFSNAEHSSQLGVTFESNAQKREYLKKNNLREFSKGSEHDKRVGSRIRERAERTARAQGFRDLGHRKETLKGELAQGWNPSKEKADKRAAQKLTATEPSG